LTSSIGRRSRRGCTAAVTEFRGVSEEPVPRSPMMIWLNITDNVDEMIIAEGIGEAAA
jgi:hypothetical protein